MTEEEMADAIMIARVRAEDAEKNARLQQAVADRARNRANVLADELAELLKQFLEVAGKLRADQDRSAKSRSARI